MYLTRRHACVLQLDDWVLCRIYKKNTNSSASTNNSCSQGPLMMGHESNDHSIPMDDHIPLPVLHPPTAAVAAITTISRLQQHQRGVAAATTNYCSALLDNDDTFFQGLLSGNDHDQDDGVRPTPTNSITNAANNNFIQLGGLAPAAASAGGSSIGGNIMLCSESKPEQLQQQLCLVTPSFQAKRALTSLHYWYDATGSYINPPAPPSKRFQSYNNSSGGSSNSNNSTNSIIDSIATNIDGSINVNCNAKNNNDHADDDGHTNTIQNMLHQVPHGSAAAAAQDHPQHSAAARTLGGSGSSTGTIFRQVPCQLLSNMNWRSRS